MKGHIIERCYRKHGYPPGFKFKKNKPQGSTVIENQSMINEGIGNGAHGAMHTTVMANVNMFGACISESPMQAILISQEQYSRLMSFLQNIPLYLTTVGSTEHAVGQATILQINFAHSNAGQHTSGTGK